LVSCPSASPSPLSVSQQDPGWEGRLQGQRPGLCAARGLGLGPDISLPSWDSHSSLEYTHTSRSR
jgi:hypothetical protein